MNEELQKLIDDEEEAIAGYDSVIAAIDNQHLIEQLEHIRDEEKDHLEFLKKAQLNPDATYEHDEGNKYVKIVEKYILKEN